MSDSPIIGCGKLACQLIAGFGTAFVIFGLAFAFFGDVHSWLWLLVTLAALAGGSVAFVFVEELLDKLTK